MNESPDERVRQNLQGFTHSAQLLTLTGVDDPACRRLPGAISADRAVEILKAGQRIDRGTSIIGKVVLDAGLVLYDHAKYLNDLIFIGGLVFRNCTWTSLNLHQSTILFGDLELIDCRAVDEGHAIISLEGVACSGQVTIQNLVARGFQSCLDMRGLYAQGGVTVESITCPIYVSDKQLLAVLEESDEFVEVRYTTSNEFPAQLLDQARIGF